MYLGVLEYPPGGGCARWPGGPCGLGISPDCPGETPGGGPTAGGALDADGVATGGTCCAGAEDGVFTVVWAGGAAEVVVDWGCGGVASGGVCAAAGPEDVEE